MSKEPSAHHGAVNQNGGYVKIVGLSGSPSPNSRSKILVEHTLIQLALLGLSDVHLTGSHGYADVQLIDLSLLSSDALLGRRQDAAVDEAICQASEADILLIGTPIYQATYTGLLKVFFDLFPKRALAGTVVGLIATGGSSLHALAIDHGLRPLVAALGGTSAGQGLYVTDKLFPDKTQIPTEVSDQARELAHELGSLVRLRSAWSLTAGEAHPITTLWRNGV